MGPVVRRFSDVGSTDLTPRCADRRPKSAKARNRAGRSWESGAAGVWRRKKAMGIWARERQWGAEKVLQCSQCGQCERVGVNERAVGCAGCLPARLSAN
jgi:hypothetical protein